MDLQEAWDEAIKETEIIRGRSQVLSTTKTEELSYIFLSESEVNIGDTLVRKGKVLVHEPSIILPKNCPLFEGFGFDKDFGVNNELVKSFLLVRGVSLPSLEFTNELAGMDLYEGSLDNAAEYFFDQFERTEDVDTSLICGPEACYQMSVLIFVATMIAQSVPTDLQKLMRDYHKKRGQ